MTEPRIVVVMNMIAPYRIPLFNELAARCRAIHVIFLRSRGSSRSWDVPLEEIRFSHEVLRQNDQVRSRLSNLSNVCARLIRSLREHRPDVLILCGWADLEMWLALLWCRLLRIPIALWCGVTPNSARRRGGFHRWLRKQFVTSVNSHVSYHSVAASTLIEMGVSPDRIAIGRNVGDIDFYHSRVRELRRSDGFPAEQGQWSRPTFLFVGSLLPDKGVSLFLRALSLLDEDEDWSALIVGSGPEDETLRTICRERRLERVRFVSFQQRDDLVKYFSYADIFVLPSLRELGAIVLSEALASGLFVLASRHDGLAPDLIMPGINGAIFDPQDQAGFTRGLRSAMSIVKNDPGIRERIAADFMNTAPLKHYAQAIIDGARLALEQSGSTHECKGKR